MIRKRIIPFILFCLILLINWHNTFMHTHHGDAEKEFVVLHQHDHDHHHHHSHHEGALLDWIKQVFGDLEHPDLGENHLELFLHTGNQIGLDQPFAIGLQPFVNSSLKLSISGFDTNQKKKPPSGVLSFADPPFFDSFSNRGPPLFS